MICAGVSQLESEAACIRAYRTRRPTMTVKDQSNIQWLTSLDEALAQAKQQDKPVLLDFFSPT